MNKIIVKETEDGFFVRGDEGVLFAESLRDLREILVDSKAVEPVSSHWHSKLNALPDAVANLEKRFNSLIDQRQMNDDLSPWINQLWSKEDSEELDLLAETLDAINGE